ncbi:MULTISPECIES: hypothetical protein [unclassified Stenotrophomonas]|uniref:hypothetical protein n=1 Tax=unclassified Stenotrophomonas TaxID=196198 RepID=UPI001310EB79|nr:MULTISPECIES: hypothetical protein [unclassified Stenotrophomonas]
MPASDALSDADFRALADQLLALDAGRLPPPLPPHLRAHPVAGLAAIGQLDQAVVALMGDVPNPWRGLLLR